MPKTKIICYINMFIEQQKIIIIRETNFNPEIHLVDFKNLSKTIVNYAYVDSIYNIELIGPIKYLENIKREILKIEQLAYKKNQLNINIKNRE